MAKQPWDKPRPPAKWQQKRDPKEWSRKRRELARLNLPRDGLLLGKNVELDLPFHITPEQLSTHMQVLGATGKGKSYFLEAMIKQLITAGHGLCLIDPHGDVYDRVLDYCAHLDRTQPKLGLAERVIPFNIAERRKIMGFNPVRQNARTITYQVVSLMEAIRKCWGEASFYEKPRLARWLYNTAYAVIESQATFLQTYDMAIAQGDARKREAITRRLKNPRIRAEWEHFNQLELREQEERLEPVLNRLKPFVEAPVRAVIGQWENTLDFSAVLRGRKILLVNLARQGVINDDERHLLGSLLVNDLLTAAFARRKEERTPFFLFVDEFQNFVTKDACEILDGGRKFGLHLILGHQHLRQLEIKDPEVYYSALTNARAKAVFGGMSDEDLEVIAGEMHRLDPNKIKHEIWRTYFAPKETTRLVTTHGGGDSSGLVNHESLATGQTHIPGSEEWSTSTTFTRGSSTSHGSSSSYSESLVPFYEQHEQRELSSVTFQQLAEQLYLKKWQMKAEPRQHCQILMPDKEVQRLKVGTLRDFPVSDSRRGEFLEACFESAGCFKAPEEAEREIKAFEEKLLLGVQPRIEVAASPGKQKKPAKQAKTVFEQLEDEAIGKE